MSAAEDRELYAAEERRLRLTAEDAKRRGLSVVPKATAQDAPQSELADDAMRSSRDAVEGAADGLFRAQVPAGKWRAGYVGHRLARRFRGREVWDVAFRLTEPVDVPAVGRVYRPDELAHFIGTTLPRCVNKLEKRERPSLTSTFAADYRVVVERLPPRDLHRLTPRDIYFGVELEVLVSFVERDSKGFEVPEGARYSVVRRILRRTAGRPPAWGDRREPGCV